MNGMDYIKIFRGDDSDALGYQTIVGTIKTDLDLTGCRAIFRYLGFFQEFDPIPEDGKLTIVIPAQSSRGFPPGVGYASLKVYDQLGKVRTFTNRIPVIVDAMTPVCPCGGNFEVSFSPFPELEPLKIFVGPGADDFDEYTGFLSKIIDRASLEKYGLTILADAMGEDGGSTGKAASPLAVKAAYDAIIKELTDNYYTAQETDEAIDSLAAYYITSNAAGAAFPTRAALINAQTYYSGGAARTPTRNDYAVVLADETHDGAEYRYIYAVADGATTGGWQAQYPVGGVMTIDPSVTKNSANPVSSSGIWSAIWGALASLPTGFASLYDWCVSQLAGKASTADATLTERGPNHDGFSAWTCTAMPEGISDFSFTVSHFEGAPANYWKLGCSGVYCGISFEVSSGEEPTMGTATSVTFENVYGPWGGGTFAFARTQIPGYQLGSQDDKPVASEAEAEALRTGKADKPTTSTNNNLAALDANGNLKDSGKTPADFATAEQGGRADAVFGLFEEVPGYDIPAIRLAGFRVPWGVAGYIEFVNGGVHFYHPAAHGNPGVDYTTEWPFKTGKFATTGDIPDVSAKLDSTSSAPAFSSDSSTQYAVGAHVTYNGKLYKCTTATTGGTWVAGSWAEDTMTDPDAVLDITSQNQLRVVAKDGTLLWAQGYDLASTSSATLACDATNNFTFADGATSQAFTLPTAPTGKVGDFGLDIDNSANTGAATMTLTGLDTTFSVVVPKGESLTDMLSIAAGELARFYISLSTFRVNNLPTWHILKQVVENGGATA